MQVGDLVEITVDDLELWRFRPNSSPASATAHLLRQGAFFAVVVDVLQEVDELGFVKDPNDWAYTVSMSHRPALHRRVFECEVEKVS